MQSFKQDKTIFIKYRGVIGKMKKNREDKEEDIIFEFIRDLDLSDARVKKRLLMECSRQELFQTWVGKKFIQRLLTENEKEVIEGKDSKWKRYRTQAAIVGSLLTVILGGIYVTIHFMDVNIGEASAMAVLLPYHPLAQFPWNNDSNHKELNAVHLGDNFGMSHMMEDDLLNNQTGLMLEFEEAFTKYRVEKEFSGDIKYISDTYMIYESMDRKIEQEELDELSYEQLHLALYEIYARHGRRFYDVNLQSYFNEKSWYVPLSEEVRFTEDVFNEHERYNIVAIKETMDRYEEEHKTVVYDYDSVTIENMRHCLQEIYSIQKNYLYCFTITQYYNTDQDFKQCFETQKECLKEALQYSLLDANIDQAEDETIRAMFMNLQEAGYLIDGEYVRNNMGAI